MARYATLIPGTVEAVDEMRRRGYRIGSTTGYMRSAADITAAIAAEFALNPVQQRQQSPRRQVRPHQADGIHVIGVGRIRPGLRSPEGRDTDKADPGLLHCLQRRFQNPLGRVIVAG